MKPAALLCLSLAACGNLDPNIGPWRVEQPASDDGGLSDPDAAPDGNVEPGTVSFARDIRPLIMRTKDQATAMGTGRGCAPCHIRGLTNATGTALSGFDVTTLGELRKGGGYTDTRIIVPGKPDESYMVKALRGQFGSNRMPKGGPYWEEGSEEMRLLTTWIAEGANGNASD